MSPGQNDKENGEIARLAAIAETKITPRLRSTRTRVVPDPRYSIVRTHEKNE